MRILCYHGFAIDDEVKFRPQLYIEPKTFRKRLRFLSDNRNTYPVLKLSEALERQQRGTLPSCAAVITVDDGFYSTLSKATPIFEEFAIPATLYLTTYYVLKHNPIFRLAIQYMFWVSRCEKVVVSGQPWCGDVSISMSDSAKRDQVMWDIICYGEKQLDEAQRLALAAEIGRLLNVDFEALCQSRKVSLLTPEEVVQLSKVLEIQLHTHRHVFPLESEQAARKEIDDNRQVIHETLNQTPDHFCYPSGIWSKAQWPWLERAGVKSATTCLPGLNYKDTPKYGLLRFLDSESSSQIEFEAELSGYLDLFRRIRSKLMKEQFIDG